MRGSRLMGGAALAVLVAALAGPAAAQVATNITPDTAAALTTGTHVASAGGVTTIDGGTRAGGNLFHSFTTFNLATGETARWTSPNASSVANVINRVTGGGFSTISGTIDTTGLPNADFYFINPAGVLFTAGARLDVPKAAYISTAADGVSFADGARFSTLAGRSSSFSMSAPQSFGFLGFEGNILIDGVNGLDGSFIALTSNLSLSGANVGIRNSSIVPLRFDMTATGTQARSTAIADPLAGAALGGQAVLLNSSVTATGTGKGLAAVRIGAGDVEVIGGFLTANTRFAEDGSDLIIKAPLVNITGFVAANTGGVLVGGDGGNVLVTAGSLRVGDSGQISASTFGAGNAGNLVINADSVLVEDASIGSDSLLPETTGRGGLVQINTGSLIVRDLGEISSISNGRGDAGAINITAGSVLVDNAGIDSNTLAGSGNGGRVTIAADTLTLSNLGEIGTSSFSAGDAGTIQLSVGKMTMSSNGLIFSTSSATGAAGDVTIVATSMAVNGSLISTDTDGPGPGGNITIAAKAFSMDRGQISTDTKGSGRAGVVTITAPDLTVADSIISSETTSSGGGGDVVLSATRLTVSDDALISSATNASGAAGKVSITADTGTFDFSEVHSQANEGSTGAAGTVALNIATLKVTNQTVLSSATFGAGDAGLVSIVGKDVTLDHSAAVSRALEGSTGNAGQVVVRAGTLSMVNGAGISSSTSSVGNAGGVTITATKVALDSEATIESGAAIGSSGNGGTVAITADELSLRGFGSIVSSTLSTGDAGQLQINAGKITVAEGSLLSSRTLSATGGSAGSISITAKSLDLESGGQIETSSRNRTTAGAINVASSGPINISGANSHIASENLSVGGGAAGSIVVSGAPIILRDGGAISTNATTGAAGDITLLAPSTSYLELEGKTAPGVVTTSSGPGTGGRIIISDPLAVISNGGRILALGQSRGANVQLKSDFFIRSSDRVNELSVDGVLVVDSQVSDVSAGVAIPEVTFLDASKVLRGQCPAARTNGITSQLSLRAFGPYAGAKAATSGVAGGPPPSACGTEASPPRPAKPHRRPSARPDARS